MIDAYLNHENSYPAFLSAVTIDLFNRQTMVAAPSSTSPPSTLRAGPQEQDAGNSAGTRSYGCGVEGWLTAVRVMMSSNQVEGFG